MPRRPWATRRRSRTGGAKRSPWRSCSPSIRSSTVSRPSTSAFQNGGSSPLRGSRPAPVIIPRSMSRTEQTPSSTSRQDSISARQVKSATSSSASGSASPGIVCSPSLKKPSPPRLGAELAVGDQLLQPLVDVEALAV